MGTALTAGDCFHSFFEFSQIFTSVFITPKKHGEHVFYFFEKILRRKQDCMIARAMFKHGSYQSHSIVSCAFQRDRCSWKFVSDSGDSLGKKISRDAVFSTRQPGSFRYALFNSRKLISHRKHSKGKMVI